MHCGVLKLGLFHQKKDELSIDFEVKKLKSKLNFHPHENCLFLTKL